MVIREIGRGGPHGPALRSRFGRWSQRDGDPFIGGQPGHPKHEREPFGPDQINRVRTYRLKCCPDRGGRLKRLRAAPRTIQQVEMIERPIRIVEHRGERYWCRHCQTEHTACLPRHVVKGGLAGANLTALVAYLRR